MDCKHGIFELVFLNVGMMWYCSLPILDPKIKHYCVQMNKICNAHYMFRLGFYLCIQVTDHPSTMYSELNHGMSLKTEHNGHLRFA